MWDRKTHTNVTQKMQNMYPGPFLNGHKAPVDALSDNKNLPVLRLSHNLKPEKWCNSEGFNVAAHLATTGCNDLLEHFFQCLVDRCDIGNAGGDRAKLPCGEGARIQVGDVQGPSQFSHTCASFDVQAKTATGFERSEEFS
ncbi:hypothetical protein M427DRAFT_59820 [Gonapodya prolifera JEL478]|uniref:Uncharacterized protein n=1 Tax=Gonapodya prolifera (strain JEL478) TaxID=1344416 RepID=A0A139A6R3_GONPJ|nr:hypothetical protein M427DRAFT_59820 [Gonapodya prolifera JEL478]|eukprot:KXS12135.1 hypothetical protein M427DRAFT_59820 [Gonapodya prolifera JEL478]